MVDYFLEKKDKFSRDFGLNILLSLDPVPQHCFWTRVVPDTDLAG